MKKVAIVTGGSSGIGKSAAKALRDAGCAVYELSRRESEQNGIVHIKADITNESDVEIAVREIYEKEGKIDILINNAGMGISGAVEFTETEEAKRLFEVNFFGMVRVTKAVLPFMREAGKGRIVNVGSVAGEVSIPFQTYYSASKAAVRSYSLALANEVKPFGISVCVFQPGDIQTGFTAAREKSHIGDDLYGGRIERSVCGMEKDEQNGMSPETAGRFLARLALKKRIKPLYSLGFGYRCICVLLKILPSSVINKIVYLLYAK